jgi:hypothetical protein
VLEVQLREPGVECEPAGDVRQPVTQPFWFGLRSSLERSRVWV